MPNQTKPHIMVLGGGFGGLETAFYLRMRLPVEQANITLVSDRSYFLFKPGLIYVPFGLNPENLKTPLDMPTDEQDIRFTRAVVRDVDPRAKIVLTNEGSQHYDYAVIAIGAGSFAGEVPGQSKYAETIYTPSAMLDLRKALLTLAQKAKVGQHQAVLFVLPPNNRCVSPLYEVALMLDTWLRRKRVRDEIDLEWTTCERSYVQAFGPRVNEMVLAEFETRGISNYTRYVATRIEQDSVIYENGQRLPYDLLITFPAHGPSRLFRSLPSDERGFISVDIASRQVKDCPALFTGDGIESQGVLVNVDRPREGRIPPSNCCWSVC